MQRNKKLSSRWCVCVWQCFHYHSIVIYCVSLYTHFQTNTDSWCERWWDSMFVCLSLIHCKNLRQYLTKTISSIDTISWPGISPSCSKLISLWSFTSFSPLLSYTLCCVLIIGLVCVCVSVCLEVEQGGHFLGEEGSQMGLVISPYIWFYSCPVFHTYIHTHITHTQLL